MDTEGFFKDVVQPITCYGISSEAIPQFPMLTGLPLAEHPRLCMTSIIGSRVDRGWLWKIVIAEYRPLTIVDANPNSPTYGKAVFEDKKEPAKLPDGFRFALPEEAEEFARPISS